MKRKLFALALAGAMVGSTATVSVAHHRDDHTENYHGLCTAYFSGSEQGRNNKQQNGTAFVTFREETVGDYNDDDNVDNQDVMDFCTDMTGGYGNPGQGEGSGPDSGQENNGKGNGRTPS